MKLDEREKIHNFNSPEWRANTLVRGVPWNTRVPNNTSIRSDIISEIYRDKTKDRQTDKMDSCTRRILSIRTEVESSASIHTVREFNEACRSIFPVTMEAFCREICLFTFGTPLCCDLSPLKNK